MGLNKSTGNMYEFVTHTWNTVKGKCYHDCSYCYMKRWGKLNPIRLDEKEFKTDLGSGNFIFVGSSNDMFAEDVDPAWVIKTLQHCEKHNENKYLFQTKNPADFVGHGTGITSLNNFALCITLESNRFYDDIMGNSPHPIERVRSFSSIPIVEKYITIEPIMDFDLNGFLQMIKLCNPKQVNIGADSGGHGLLEPSKEKLELLIQELEKFTIVKKKKNLTRLLK